MSREISKRKNIIIGLVTVPTTIGIIVALRHYLPENVFPFALMGCIAAMLVLEFFHKKYKGKNDQMDN